MLIGLFLLFTAPGCRDNKKASEGKMTDTTHVAATQPASSIVTTPYNMLVMVHKTGGYQKFKAAYLAGDSLRLSYGLHNYIVGRTLADTNAVVVAMKAEDMGKAKSYTGSTDLKKYLNAAGVIGHPEAYPILVVWQDTALIVPMPRSMTLLTVKDWATWWKVFQEGEQERKEHGVVARLVGHDPDDPTKVSVVTALTDTAIAFAYFRSDLLKKRMEASGVVGTPQRRIFEIVQRN